VPAALAHRDDRQPDVRRGRSDPGARHREGGVQGAGREVRELRGHVVESHVVAQVAGREPQEQSPVGDPQGVHAAGVVLAVTP
jgi:hypothetical protein